MAKWIIHCQFKDFVKTSTRGSVPADRNNETMKCRLLIAGDVYDSLDERAEDGARCRAPVVSLCSWIP